MRVFVDGYGVGDRHGFDACVQFVQFKVFHVLQNARRSRNYFHGVADRHFLYGFVDIVQRSSYFYRDVAVRVGYRQFAIPKVFQYRRSVVADFDGVGYFHIVYGAVQFPYFNRVTAFAARSQILHYLRRAFVNVQNVGNISVVDYRIHLRRQFRKRQFAQILQQTAGGGVIRSRFVVVNDVDKGIQGIIVYRAESVADGFGQEFVVLEQRNVGRQSYAE